MFRPRSVRRLPCPLVLPEDLPSHRQLEYRPVDVWSCAQSSSVDILAVSAQMSKNYSVVISTLLLSLVTVHRVGEVSRRSPRHRCHVAADSALVRLQEAGWDAVSCQDRFGSLHWSPAAECFQIACWRAFCLVSVFLDQFIVLFLLQVVANT